MTSNVVLIPIISIQSIESSVDGLPPMRAIGEVHKLSDNQGVYHFAHQY